MQELPQVTDLHYENKKVKYNAHGYQTRASKFVVEHKKCALHIDMGLGKTVAVLTALKSLLDDFACKGVLVMAPLRVCTLTWPDEIKKWDHLSHLSLGVVRGDNTQRMKVLFEQHDIYIINYDQTAWMCEWILACRDDLPFDVLVLDESSKLKAGSSKRFKKLKVVATSPLFKRVVEMTGTPMPERYENLWSQYYLLDKGERLMPFVSHFRSRWMIQNEYNRFERKMRPGAAKEIQNNIREITLAMRAEDWLKLPKLIVNDIMLNLPPKARAVHDELEKEMVVELNGKEIIASNAAIVGEKCRQAASGALYHEVDGEKRTIERLHDVKLDALAEIIEEAEEPLLVAFWYNWESQEFKKRWPKAPILGSGVSDKEASRIIGLWNARKIPLLFMHPMSVGHGINLQEGGNILVFTVLPWSGEAYDQTIHRLLRMGQKKAVVVHRLLIKDSPDERVAKALKFKDFAQTSLLKALTSVKNRSVSVKKGTTIGV